jgi:membrane fusion protein, heavy metal efflux system
MKLQTLRSVSFIICMTFAFAACNGGTDSGGKAAKVDASGRCPHEIKQEKCPFCVPSLIESDGFCGAHGVAEALCFQCRPYLKAAFRVKGDWCAEHNFPESQCVLCNPELKEKMRPGEHGVKTAGTGTATNVDATAAANCEHGIAKTKCPFCTPSLIESQGFCGGCNIAEALCVKCSPFLETAFKAKGDWCTEHNIPESQCAMCNPELKNPPNYGKVQG